MMALLAATLGFCASLAHAQTTNVDRVYAIDQRGDVVMDPFGLCWRTGFWTPAAAAKDPAGCQCDKDLLPKEACEKVAVAQPPVKDRVPGIGGGKVTLAADALFDFNKAVLRPEGRAKLDDVAAKASQLTLEVVIAVGHADRIGGAAYNQRLSERRATAVKDYLVSKGIPANRVYTEGKGSTQPVTQPGECKGPRSAKVIACLQPDRRVDIEIIGTQK